MEGMVAPNPMTADELKVGHQPSRAVLMQSVVDVIPLWCVIGMFECIIYWTYHCMWYHIIMLYHQSWLTIHQNYIVPCWLLKWNVTTQNHMQQSKAHSLVVPFGRRFVSPSPPRPKKLAGVPHWWASPVRCQSRRHLLWYASRYHTVDIIGSHEGSRSFLRYSYIFIHIH